jgi:hypothetical protein
LASLLGRSSLSGGLPNDVLERLLPDFSLVELTAGHTLIEPHTRGARAVFPLAGVMSLTQEMSDGTSAQVAVVGNEGLLGLPLFMGGGAMPMRGVVQCAGYGLILGCDPLLAEFERGGAFMRHLLRYTQALVTQISQLVVCNRYHSIEQQLCRALLMSLDRMQGHEVPLTQEFVARQLGVRREGVTEACCRLRDAGIVGRGRGVFAVHDRGALEARSCGCYRVIEGEYKRLLPACSMPVSVNAPTTPDRIESAVLKHRCPDLN